MAEQFVSLAAFLRVAPTAGIAAAPVIDETPRAAAVAELEHVPAAPNAERGIIDFAHADVVHELALMKLAAIESFESAARKLLRSLAGDVLGRELFLAPVEIDSLVSAAIVAFGEADPVALAVSAADAKRVRSPLPLRVDNSLVAGDLVVDVRDGSIESRFTFRLEAALERAERGL